MGSLSLVDELPNLESHLARHAVADFAATIAASNGMPIPLELLVQTHLPASANLNHAQLVKREYPRSFP